MRVIAALAALLLWLMPALALGQAQPDLVVAVRDADGRSISGVTVTVRDVEGLEVFAGLTDAQGQVAVAHVPSPELRVAVNGRVGGVELVQLGDDALGVLVFLAAPPLLVELRVDSGGVVIPGPAMLALEPVDVPTAQVGPGAAPSSQPVATLVGAPQAPSSPQGGSRSSQEVLSSRQEAPEGSGVLIGIVAVAVVLAAIVAILAHERRVV